MSKTRKIKELRQDIRSRFNSPQTEQVVKEFLKVMEGNDKKLKRIYLTALSPLVYDQANKET